MTNQPSPGQPSPEQGAFSVNVFERFLRSVADIASIKEKSEQKDSLTPQSQAHVVNGPSLVVPDSMTTDQVVQVLRRRDQARSQVIDIMEVFDVTPFDGAHALLRVLKDRFTYLSNVGQRTLFGEKPPRLIEVKVGHRQSESVPWDAFQLPIGDGEVIVTPGYTQTEKGLLFQLTARLQRRFEPEMRMIFQAVRDFLKNGGSIYNGKPLMVKFTDSEDDDLPMPSIDFMDTAVTPDELAFNDDTMAAVNANLFLPISRWADLQNNGISLKRGVLLGGTYGTGKTLTARVAAKLATDAKVTFLYLAKASDIPKAIQFARLYSKPAIVLFVEDIDSVLHGHRGMSLNDILNTIDGVDTKDLNLITLMTTNHIERINAAMLRPGRLDAVIHVDTPNAKTVERLLRQYGRGLVSPNANLSAVAEELSGSIPAIIAEVVKRAKLSQLSKQEPGTMLEEISAEALLEAAKGIRAQRDLIQKAPTGMEPEPEGRVIAAYGGQVYTQRSI